MGTYRILLSGPLVPFDQDLIRVLQQQAQILTNSENRQIEPILQKQKVNLIIFEITKKNTIDVAVIKNIKNKFAEIPIILIDGNGNTDIIVQAYSYGVKDVFKKPYKCYLVAERANALLRQQNQ